MFYNYTPPATPKFTTRGGCPVRSWCWCVQRIGTPPRPESLGHGLFAKLRVHKSPTLLPMHETILLHGLCLLEEAVSSRDQPTTDYRFYHLYLHRQLELRGCHQRAASDCALPAPLGSRPTDRYGVLPHGLHGLLPPSGGGTQGVLCSAEGEEPPNALKVVGKRFSCSNRSSSFAWMNAGCPIGTPRTTKPHSRGDLSRTHEKHTSWRSYFTRMHTWHCPATDPSAGTVPTRSALYRAGEPGTADRQAILQSSCDFVAGRCRFARRCGSSAATWQRHH